MTIYKRGEHWTYEFKCQGKRYKKSTGTADEHLATLMEQEAKKKVQHQQFEDSPLLSVLVSDVEKKQKEVASTINKIKHGEPVQGDLFVQDAKRQHHGKLQVAKKRRKK